MEQGKGPIHWPEDPPETRYDRAGRAWDRRVGTAATQIKNWQRVAWISTGLTLAFAAATLVLALRNQVEPIIVRVGDHGGVQEVYRGVASADRTPRANEVRYFLAALVRKVRSLPLDPVLARQNWKDAYAFLTDSAARKMSQLANRENPLAKLGKETVQVRVRSVVPVSNRSELEGSYQVRWEETRFADQGAELSTRAFTGLFTIRIQPPDDEETIFKNPLGLYVEDFDWSPDV